MLADVQQLWTVACPAKKSARSDDLLGLKFSLAFLPSLQETEFLIKGSGYWFG